MGWNPEKLYPRSDLNPNKKYPKAPAQSIKYVSKIKAYKKIHDDCSNYMKILQFNWQTRLGLKQTDYFPCWGLHVTLNIVPFFKKRKETILLLIFFFVRRNDFIKKDKLLYFFCKTIWEQGSQLVGLVCLFVTWSYHQWRFCLCWFKHGNLIHTFCHV